jgi:hypothetical protein
MSFLRQCLMLMQTIPGAFDSDAVSGPEPDGRGGAGHDQRGRR